MNLSDRIPYFSYRAIFLATFFLPIKTTFGNLGIILLILLTAASFIKSGIRADTVKAPGLFLGTTLVLYLPILLGTLYAPFPEDAFFQWGKCIFYLLMPLLIFRKDLNRERVIFWATWGLFTGTLLSAFLLLTINIFEFSVSGSPITKLLGYEHTGKEFLSPLPQMHPVYYGSYIVFALVLLFRSQFRLRKGLKVLGAIILILTIVFLNSRIIFIAGLILLIIGLFRRYALKRTLLLTFGVGIFLLLAYTFLNETYLFNKLTKGAQWELSENIAEANTDKDKPADSRMSRWIVSTELFMTRPVAGHGTASARKLLLREYEVRNMQASIEQGYDSHNQYLGYAIDFGLMGICFLLAFFGFNFYEAYLQHDYVRFCFFILIAVICMTENFLIRNMGINFVALFSAIFYLRNDD